MKVLLTNDDGFDAPGLAALKASVIHFGHVAAINHLQIWVVAPDRGRSECGHSVTTGRDLRLCEYEPNSFSVDGTPVDCVRVALTQICPDVDWVFSGINAGANVGIDLLVSGTFAAAREAALHNKPAMAISHYRRPDVPKTWGHAPSTLLQPITQFVQHAESDEEQGVSVARLWNVNLPAPIPSGNRLPEICFCPVDQNPMERRSSRHRNETRSHQTTDPNRTGQEIAQSDWNVQLQSDFHGRPRCPGTDVELCFSGNLTISKISPGIS